MKKEITVKDFYKVLKGTIYEKNYGLLLNAIAHHEHTLFLERRNSEDELDRLFAHKDQQIGDKIYDYLYSKGYYDVE